MAERWRIEPDYAVRVDKNLGYLGVQQGADVHVLDRVTSGPKPALVKQLGANVRPDEALQALRRAPDDIKVVMEFAQP